MKFTYGTQSRIIQASTAEEFQAKLNEALNEISRIGSKPNVQFNMDLGFCAFVLFDQTVRQAETLAEEYEINNEEYYCSECPMFVLYPDKRVKYTTCKHGVRKVCADHRACEWFYEALEKGEVVPV